MVQYQDDAQHVVQANRARYRQQENDLASHSATSDSLTVGLTMKLGPLPRAFWVNGATNGHRVECLYHKQVDLCLSSSRGAIFFSLLDMIESGQNGSKRFSQIVPWYAQAESGPDLDYTL
jgi:hypothetical protein